MTRHVTVIGPTNAHEFANNMAIEADGAFFGRNPDRCFRLRQSMPREFEGWGPLTHLERNWMLVRVTRGRRGKFTGYQRIGVAYAGGDLPDDEAFLERLWIQYEAMTIRGDGLHYLTADQTRAIFSGPTQEGKPNG